jgi:hypothetical protein
VPPPALEPEPPPPEPLLLLLLLLLLEVELPSADWRSFFPIAVVLDKQRW